MPLTRRDILLGLGGGLAGAALTPVPWKLLDDVSIWTQRRHALPVPPRGAVSFRPAVCPLCPAACALRVRLVGARPVSTVGAFGHPLGGGACPLGLTAHHLAFHPLRLAAPAARVAGRLERLTLDSAVAGVAAAVAKAGRAGRSVVVIDRRPGRVVSEAWRELLAAVPGGVYATPPGEGATLDTLAGALEVSTPLGIDLERTRTLVSFGAPVLDGWGRPARMRAVRPGLRVVQVDAWRSPTAALADEWVPVAPDAFGLLALALAEVVGREHPTGVPAEVGRELAEFAPVRVAARTGLPAPRIEALARSLVALAPAVAIGGGDPGGGPLGAETERAIALLDVALGAIGREGGLVPRPAWPEPAARGRRAAVTPLVDVPPRSVGLLVLDGADDGRALPFSLLSRLLAPDAVVVSLSAFASGLARHAALIIPAPAPLETWDEGLPTADAAAASYSVSAPVLAKPDGATDAVELIARLGAALGTALEGSHEARLRERVAAIHAARRGCLVEWTDGGYADSGAGGVGAPWESLVAGGCWIDEPLSEPPAPARGRLARRLLPSAKTAADWPRPASGPGESGLVAFAARGTAGALPVSPLLTKLYQESDLRPSTSTVAMSPDDARDRGLHDRRRVLLESAAGAVHAELRHDPTIPRGRIALAAGPDPGDLHPAVRGVGAGALTLVEVAMDGTWRGTPVRVREA